MTDEHHQIILMLSFVYNKNVFALRSVQKKTKLKQLQFFFLLVGEQPSPLTTRWQYCHLCAKGELLDLQVMRVHHHFTVMRSVINFLAISPTDSTD